MVSHFFITMFNHRWSLLSINIKLNLRIYHLRRWHAFWTHETHNGVLEKYIASSSVTAASGNPTPAENGTLMSGLEILEVWQMDGCVQRRKCSHWWLTCSHIVVGVVCSHLFLFRFSNHRSHRYRGWLGTPVQWPFSWSHLFFHIWVELGTRTELEWCFFALDGWSGQHIPTLGYSTIKFGSFVASFILAVGLLKLKGMVFYWAGPQKQNTFC